MFPKRSSRSSDQPARRRRVAEDTENTQASSSNQYRRNQTLSSYRGTASEESSRQKVHTLTMQRRNIGGIFLIVSFATVTLALLLWQLIAQVQIVSSTKQLSTTFVSSAYEDSINEYLGLNPAQRLRFALDEAALSAFVSEALPEVESLEVKGSAGVAKSSFVITFRTPVAGWQINDSQYYVDAAGVVFEKNYYANPTVQIVDESGISPEQGSAVVGSRLLGFLGKVVSQAQSRGYTVVKAVLPEGASRGVDITLKGVSTQVKLSIDRGAGEQVEDMDRSLRFFASEKIRAEYVDVRVSGRAAYR